MQSSLSSSFGTARMMYSVKVNNPDFLTEAPVVNGSGQFVDSWLKL